MRWPLPWPKAWRSDAGEAPEDDDEDEEEEPRSLRQSVILFARDLAVAFLVVAIVMGILFGYTQVWPPMVVIESRSMQHSNSESFVGVIDTGDLVLVQAVRQPADVVTWIEGHGNGHRTYSDYGDVIIFERPNALPASTPIIHRAYAFVLANGTAGADVPSLLRLPSASWDAKSAVNGTRGNFAYGIWEFTLRNASWTEDRTLTFNATTALARGGVTSGFMTKGDNNPDVDSYGAVHVNRILGRARGELPWFGLIKLTLAPGESGCCRGWGDPVAPLNSWNALLVSLIVLIAGPFLADWGLAWWQDQRKKRRRAKEAAARKDPRPATEPAPAPAPDAPPKAGAEVTDEARTESSGPEGGGP
jgi:signal peptidase